MIKVLFEKYDEKVQKENINSMVSNFEGYTIWKFHGFLIQPSKTVRV